MTVTWEGSKQGAFDSEPLTVPGLHSFPQGAIYRLKLTNVPGHAGLQFYPTVEIGPPTPHTQKYTVDNSIPVQFAAEDFAQVLAGHFVTKVVYLPDPTLPDLSQPSVETLESTQLGPGRDPIVEADRRGSILAIIRLGNKDWQRSPDKAEIAGGVQQGPPTVNLREAGAFKPVAGIDAGGTCSQKLRPLRGDWRRTRCRRGHRHRSLFGHRDG